MICLTVVLVNLFVWPNDLAIRLPLTGANLVMVLLLYIGFVLGYHLSFQIFPSNKAFIRLIGLFLALAMATTISVLFIFPIAGFLFTLCLLRLSVFFSKPWAFALALFIPAIGVLIDVLLYRSEDPLPQGMIFLAINILVLIGHYRLLAEQKLRQAFQLQTVELRATQAFLQQSIARDERLRISRDLHDLLGHQLTALALQLEVATHTSGDTAKNHLQHARQISDQLLQSVRSAVSTIRQDGHFDLQGMLNNLAEQTPNLRFDSRIELKQNLSDLRLVQTLFFIIQEALTNCLRHAKSGVFKLHLYDDYHALHLLIEDDGSPINAFKAGNGLTGMQERVASINGTMQISLVKGFTITITLPLGETHE